MRATPVSTDPQVCSICLEDGTDDALTEASCACRGTNGMVHADCVRRWRSQFNATDPRYRHCMQCQAKYTDHSPRARDDDDGDDVHLAVDSDPEDEQRAEERAQRRRGVRKCLYVLHTACRVVCLAATLYLVVYLTAVVSLTQSVNGDACWIPDRCRTLLLSGVGGTMTVCVDWRRCRSRCAVLGLSLSVLAFPDAYLVCPCLLLSAGLVRLHAWDLRAQG